MNAYEILLMLDPELAEERQTEIVTRTKELVEKGSGSWLSHDLWGRRRLAYEIDHKTDGTYHLLQFVIGWRPKKESIGHRRWPILVEAR